MFFGFFQRFQNQLQTEFVLFRLNQSRDSPHELVSVYKIFIAKTTCTLHNFTGQSKIFFFFINEWMNQIWMNDFFIFLIIKIWFVTNEKLYNYKEPKTLWRMWFYRSWFEKHDFDSLHFSNFFINVRFYKSYISRRSNMSFKSWSWRDIIVSLPFEIKRANNEDWSQ